MEYKIIHSRRKTVAISINRCQIIVRAPYGLEERYIDGIVEKHRGWIEKKLREQRNKMENEPQLSDVEIERLKAQAKKYFQDKTKQIAEIMGLEYGRIKITSAKRRFGSCNSKKNICFSYRLMLYPEAARIYVIVHELAHLVYLNHSADFYALVARYLPEYKKYEALLK